MEDEPADQFDILSGTDITLSLGAISGYKLCDRCLGRLFSKKFRGREHAEIGKDIRGRQGLASVADTECHICRGLFRKLDDIAALPVGELKKWDYGNLWVGTRLEFGTRMREDEILSKHVFTDAEPMKVEVNRELGKRLSALTGKEGKMTNPDMLIIVDTAFRTFQLEPSPVYIYGRYRKLVRGIPQTKWPCRKCHGKGCSHCNYKGKMYDTSVEELIAQPVMVVYGGAEHFFHGMGREDIDAVMLGNGRPFILEISRPRKRTLDLGHITQLINSSNQGRVEVADLRYSTREEVRELKSATPVKRYRITFRVLGKINKQLLSEVILKLSGTKLSQRTPIRVSHRRADLVRERLVYSCSIVGVQDELVTLDVEAESGTYIKEMVTGDEGRTVPSVAQGLGEPCEVVSLDVSEVSTGAEEKW